MIRVRKQVDSGVQQKANCSLLLSKLGRFDGLDMTEDAQIRFLKKVDAASDRMLPTLLLTSHENLVNVREVLRTENETYTVFDEWGVSLAELSAVAVLGYVEVAEICRSILRGIEYIHNALGICHGSIDLTSVLVTKEGGVKIANIEKSMVEQSDPNRKCDDIEAVRLIAKNLLENKKGSLDHFTRFLLKSFANPHIEEVGDMLQHPFLQTSPGNRGLRFLRNMYVVSKYKGAESGVMVELGISSLSNL